MSQVWAKPPPLDTPSSTPSHRLLPLASTDQFGWLRSGWILWFVVDRCRTKQLMDVNGLYKPVTVFEEGTRSKMNTAMLVTRTHQSNSFFSFSTWLWSGKKLSHIRRTTMNYRRIRKIGTPNNCWHKGAYNNPGKQKVMKVCPQTTTATKKKAKRRCGPQWICTRPPWKTQGPRVRSLYDLAWSVYPFLAKIGCLQLV